ncbi:hypothetical protein COT62_01690 [Candidatus Roizmanbacteria bacterium CG09_land_8_20_14_0_10_41_9]|uniref:ParB/Spo0J HTH domain-containing protein n=1 Tax=Candidatus Roizmanbacteria bacterium CG09_land_8_20_14_0_10_41_9 TaxID=1974850 RepID=A0A2H0WT30_9BACT|nr:MAG: hypothetical protein COT62_01690 [Candidatus Roizmanbacteria bacterium CG09_land_8_20_14_0_10_41_9]
MADEEITKALETIKAEKDMFQKARMLRDVIHMNQMRIIDVAKRLSMKSSYICHILRLNKLPDIIVDGYYARLISLSHLFVISRLKEKQDMVSIYEKVLSENITVLQAEEEVRSILYSVRSEGTYLKKEEIQKFIDDIKKKHKSVGIKIVQTRIKSKLSLELKGNLAKTNTLLKSLMRYLEAWKGDEQS